MVFSHRGGDKAYRGGHKPPHGGQNGSRGGNGSKAKLCRNMQRDGFCRRGDSCGFSHDQGSSSHGPMVSTTDREQHRQPAERTRAMEKYLLWRRLINRPPVPHDFVTMKLLWSEALGFLDESDREVLHMLPRDLDNDQYCGRQHIQSLLAIETVPLHYGPMLELVLPFLQLITHHSLLSCLSVDTYIGALYNFIGGTNGSRALPFLHKCITSLIHSDSVDDGTDSALAVETNIMPIVRALRELLTREHRVLFNDDVPPLVDLIEIAGAVLCKDADAVVLQILATNVQDIRSMVARSNGLLFHAEAQKEASGSAKGRANSTYPRELVLPSGRHDNDRLDISDIKILPTTEEIRSDHEEFLPSTDPDQPHYLSDPSQRHLDTHFRLLRHDIFGELKETLGSLMTTVEASPALLADTMLTLGNLRAYTYPRSRISYISFDNKRGIEARVSFPQLLQLRKRSPSERRTWWEASKRLEEGGLLCLLFLDNGKSSSLLLTVSDKCADTKKDFTLSSDAFRATISAKLAATSQDDVTKMTWLSRNKIQCMLIELPGILVATFIPILENLQNMQRSSRLPFRQWLLPRAEHGQEVQHIPAPIYAKATSFSFGLKPILKDDGEDILVTSRTSVSDRSVIAEIERRTGLDSGQSSALVAALTREYALIQGPPGTGKSYLGVQLMRVLLAQKDVANLGPIVVV